MKIVIKEVCYNCRYLDVSLPKGRAYKCFTRDCPVRNMSRDEIDKLIISRKQTKKVRHHG